MGQAKYQVVFLGDSSNLDATLASLGSKTDSAGQKVSEVGTKAELAGRSGTRGFETFNEALQATGQNVGPVGEALEHLSQLTDQLGEHGSSAAQKLQAIGIGVAGLGGILLSAGAAEGAAAAGLKSAIEDSGKSYDDYKDKIDAVVDEQAKLGNNSEAVQGALETLTTATKDPQKALDDMGLAANIAAREHTSLQSAAEQLADVYAGKFKSVSGILGTQVQDLVDPAKELTKAQAEQARAATELSTANQNLADATARVSAAEQARAERAESAVDSAQQRAETADQNLTDVTSANADKRATAEENASTRVQDAGQKLTDLRQQQATTIGDAEQSIQDAKDKTAAADQNLADLEARIAQATQPTIDDTYSLADAQKAVTRAREDAALGLTKGEAATRAIADAEENLQKVKDEQAAKAVPSLTDQQELTKAKQDDAQAAADQAAATAKAQQQIADATSQGGKLYDELAQAVTALSKADTAQAEASKPTRAERDASTKALREQKDAHDALAKAQAAAASADSPTIAEQQELAKAHAAVTKAQAEQAKATRDVTQAQKDQADEGPKIQQVLDDLQSKTAGAAQALANTTEGEFRAALAETENFLGEFGQKYGGIITAFGVGITAIGTLADLHLVSMFAGIPAAIAPSVGVALSYVGGFVASIGEGLAAGASAVAGFAADLAAMFVEAAAGFLEMAAEAIAWGVSMAAAGLAAIAPFLPIILAVAAVGVAAYELYKHWGEVWGFIKDISQDVWHFLKSIFDDVVHLGFDLITGELDILSAAWHLAWKGIGDAVTWVWVNVIKPIGGFFTGVWNDITTDIETLRDSFEIVFNDIAQLVGAAINLMIEGINLLIKGLDSIQVSVPSWVPFIGGDSFGLNIPQVPTITIPKLAAGGIVPATPGGRMVLVGEGGNDEAVIPLPRGGSGGMGGDVHLHVHIPAGAIITDPDAFLRMVKGPMTDYVHQELLRRQSQGNDLQLAGR